MGTLVVLKIQERLCCQGKMQINLLDSNLIYSHSSSPEEINTKFIVYSSKNRFYLNVN